MKRLAGFSFGLDLITAIGSWTRIVCLGMTYWITFEPAAWFAVIDSASKVSRTSPSPETKAAVAFEPDVGWATTFLNSALT